MADFTKQEEIRLHALGVAASNYKELFRIGKDEAEPPLADQIVADAEKFVAFIKGADDGGEG